MKNKPRFPGIRVTANGNQLVSYHTETRIADAGVFYPITPSTEGGELFQQAFAEGNLNVFGHNTIAVEAEGEHAAQGGAIAHSVCGKRVVNYTSGQGVVYGIEQYYHAPGKCSTMVLEVAARALTKHALNVHCGHDDVYGALDTGWIIAFAFSFSELALVAFLYGPKSSVLSTLFLSLWTAGELERASVVGIVTTAIVLTIVLLVQLLLPGPLGYDKWAGIFAAQWMKVFTFVVIVSLAWHAWVGVRDIVMDYVKPAWLRLTLYVLVILTLVAYAGWSVQILWRA